MVKPIRNLELHYPVIQFLIKANSSGEAVAVMREIAPSKNCLVSFNIKLRAWLISTKVFQNCTFGEQWYRKL